MKHSHRWLAVPVLAALALSACGSDEKSSTTTAATSTPTTAAGVTTSAAAATTSAAATTTAKGSTPAASSPAASTPAAGSTPSTGADDLGSGKSKLVTDATGALKDVCPATVIVQTDWFPESEHGELYQLMGPGYQADKDKGSVTGPLTFRGQDTGVKLEIRAGGPFLGNQNVTSAMYQDPSILLGYAATSDAVKLAKDFPMVSVVAPFAKSPLAIMWDADKHPTAKTISDIAKEVDKITVFNGSAYVDFLIATGVAPADKFDFNYKGDKILVTEGATTAHQGFATSEPFQYANLDTGAIDVAYQLVYDTGWQPYPQTLAVRADKVEPNRACLEKLVPMIQQSQIDYLKDHAAADKVIIDTNNTYASFWEYTQADADFSVQQQLALGIVANEATPTLGDMENPRVTEFISQAIPVFVKQGVDVPTDLTAADIVNNEFLDPSITMTS